MQRIRLTLPIIDARSLVYLPVGGTRGKEYGRRYPHRTRRHSKPQIGFYPHRRICVLRESEAAALAEAIWIMPVGLAASSIHDAVRVGDVGKVKALCGLRMPADFQTEYCEWKFVEFLKYEIGHLHGLKESPPHSLARGLTCAIIDSSQVSSWFPPAPSGPACHRYCIRSERPIAGYAHHRWSTRPWRSPCGPPS